MANIVVLPVVYVDGQVLTASDLNSNFNTLNAATIPVTNGGTGLAAGTSGGVLYFSSTTAIGSSGALTQYGVVYGGGAGAAPTATAAGSTGQVLTATTGAAPAFAVPSVNGQCQLTYVSGTSIKLLPYNGQGIQIAGALYPIPSAGVASGNPTTASNYVDGVASQTLAASTLYYVYVFNNSGTLTLDFSTTGHSTDTTAGNIGVEIKTATASRTLVGMVRTNATPNFVNSATQRFVSTYYNRRTLGLVNGFTANRTTTSTTYVELNSEIRCEFVTWADEAVIATSSIIANSNGTSGHAVALSVNGSTTPEDAQVFTETGGSTNLPLNPAINKALTEGYNYLTLVGCDTGGATLTLRGAAIPSSSTPTLRSTISVAVRG